MTVDAPHGRNASMLRMLTTSELRVAWAPACSVPLVRFRLHGGAVVSVHELIVPALEMLSAVLAAHGYEATPPDTGAYNCRKITGGSGYSLHAYGIAVDINWLDNPYGPRLVTDMPDEMIRDIEAIRTAGNRPVWRWGGRFRGNKDAMHFEVACRPEELTAGPLTTTRPTTPEVPEVKEETAQALLAATREQTEELRRLRIDVKGVAVGGWGHPTGVFQLLESIRKAVTK